MHLPFSLHQAVTVGPRITSRKVLRKLRRMLFPEPLPSAGETTFVDVHQASPLAWKSCIELPSIELLRQHETSYLHIADSAVEQRLWVGGHGPTPCTHDAVAPGIDGIRFSPSAPFVPMSDAREWIRSVINIGNAEEALRRHALLPGDYVPIDWQRDARSGYTWSEGVPSSALRIAPERGADPKCAWDLARMHHLLHLAFAHALVPTVEQRRGYCDTFRSHVIDVLAHNPPGYGIQWTVPMEVAIRMANIMVALDFFMQQDIRFDQTFLDLVRQGMHEHASWVMSHLEWSDGMRGNHYLSNLAGLSVYAAYADTCELKERIMRVLRQGLDTECMFQFHGDGSHFEASLHYHVFSAEMLSWSYLFMAKATAGFAVRPVIQERLAAVARFTASIHSKRGLVPQIGDNDCGRFLPLRPMMDQASPWEHMMDRCDILALTREVANARSLQECSPTNAMLAMHTDDTVSASSYHSADDFGLAILRHAGFEVYGRAGSIGQMGRGGHCHNDQLAFVLYVDGFEFICDPGTYVYTALPDQRNRFRSTSVHSTLSLAGTEQHRIPDDMREGLFWLQSDDARARTLKCSHDEWVAEHHAFGPAHVRRVCIEGDLIRVQDECAHHAQKHIVCMLHPAVNVQRNEHGIVCTRDGISMLLQCAADIDIMPEWYSPEYGMRVPTTSLRMDTTDTRHEFTFARIPSSSTSATEQTTR